MDLAAFLGAAAFCGGMIYAAYCDLSHRILPNRIALSLVIVFAALVPWLEADGGATVMAVAASLAVFLVGLFVFSKGWLGGGDVKLAAVAALWLGAPFTPVFLLATMLFGAALAAIHMLRVRLGGATTVSKAEFAYGPAIALSAILLLPFSPWGWIGAVSGSG